MTNDILFGLNNEQRQAVLHNHQTDGPLLLLAGAGSGKTSVLTKRIIYLIQNGTLPSAILGLTFTGKAAAEMAERVRRAIPGSRVRLCTFHSLALSILRETFPDGRSGWRKVGLRHSPFPSEVMEREWLQELAAIGLLKSGLLREELFNPQHDNVRGIARLRKTVLNSGSVAFEDLIHLAYRLLRQDGLVQKHCRSRWQYILVDEYQDINAAQYALVRDLLGSSPNLFVVGDDDQAIYGFRGADIGNILRFRADYPNCRILKLEWNYRSTPAILGMANGIFNDKPIVLQKNLKAGSPSKGALFDVNLPVQVWRSNTPRQEMEKLCNTMEELRRDYALQWGDFAILVRYNRQVHWYSMALEKMGIPIGFAKSEPGITVETVHAAKGLQYPVVFYCGLAMGLTPGECKGGRTLRTKQAQEERRLFYVGVTRAESLLVLLFCAQRHWKGVLQNFAPSPFLRLVKVLPPQGNCTLPPLLFKFVVSIRVLFYMAWRMAYYPLLRLFYQSKRKLWLENQIQKFCRFSLRELNIDLQIHNAGKTALVDWERPVFVVANHQSFADIPVCLLAAGRLLGFIAKQELMRIPFLAFWMREIGCVMVDRKRPGVGVRLGEGLLKKDKSRLAIFAEGTRSINGQVGEFKSGAFWMALQSKGIILPLAIHGTRKAWEDYNKGKEQKKCWVKVLDPIDCSKESRSAKELALAVRNIIANELSG